MLAYLNHTTVRSTIVPTTHCVFTNLINRGIHTGIKNLHCLSLYTYTMSKTSRLTLWSDKYVRNTNLCFLFRIAVCYWKNIDSYMYTYIVYKMIVHFSLVFVQLWRKVLCTKSSLESWKHTAAVPLTHYITEDVFISVYRYWGENTLLLTPRGSAFPCCWD
jgi:hypothetical protein